MKTIMIIEDDESISHGIAFTFKKEGYKVLTAESVREAHNLFSQNKIDLVILDVGLPDGSGLDLCEMIREKSATPIIMLTANNLETDEVSGFLAGADDYITKPFSLSILRARVNALLRRTEKSGMVMTSGDFTLDKNLCKLFRAGLEIDISTTEYKIILYMMSNAGQVLSKEQILSALWDNTGNFVDENTLPVNISRIRAKIETDPKNPKTIKTVHGIGYLWSEE